MCYQRNQTVALKHRMYPKANYQNTLNDKIWKVTIATFIQTFCEIKIRKEIITEFVTQWTIISNELHNSIVYVVLCLKLRDVHVNSLYQLLTCMNTSIMEMIWMGQSWRWWHFSVKSHCKLLVTKHKLFFCCFFFCFFKCW